MKPMDQVTRVKARYPLEKNPRSITGLISSYANSVLLSMTVAVLIACTNGSSGTGSGTRITVGVIPAGSASFELLDPTPAAGDRFGQVVRILTNGNIVVSDVFDSSVAAGNGAVHVFNPVTQSIVDSVYGEEAGDNLGSGGIVALPNGNFVVVSPADDDGANVDVSSIRLVNGTTGMQIGATMYGDAGGDNLGFEMFTLQTLITPLGNNNFVISSPYDNGFTGSVQLVSGVDGTLLATLVGAAAFDTFGLGGAVALGNDNFVIVSPAVSLGFFSQEGSVTYVDGTTGVPIATYTGDNPSDQLGVGGVVALSNDNFVISSPLDDRLVADAGSIMLIDGASGAVINTLEGDTVNDRLGFSIIGGVKALDNDNFVVSSSVDDEAFVDGGSVRLVSGNTGTVLGTIAGTSANEQLELVTVHSNDTFVVASPLFDTTVGPTVLDAGSIRLFSGVDASPIGAAFTGDTADDRIGLGSVIELANNNYAIASTQDDVGGIVDAGSIMVFDGVAGSPIGAINGEESGDQLGFGNIIALANGNFAVASIMDDDGAMVDAGSVRLVNGASGAQIAAIIGDFAGDMIGSGNIVALADSNFVILSDFDDEGGNADVGSVRLINGATGAEIGTTFVGTAANDIAEAAVAPAAAGGDYVLGLSRADKDGLVDSGQVFLVTD